MRTLHLIGTLNPASGGPAASVSMLIEFSRNGDSGEAVTLDDPDSGFLKTLPFPVTALGPAMSKFAYSHRLIPWLAANRDRFDACIVHGLWQFGGFAVRWTFAGRKPYFVFVHGMLDPYFKRAFPFKHLKKYLYWRLAEYAVLRDATAVLFTCNEEERLARQSFELHGWRSAVIPYGSRIPPADLAHCGRGFLRKFPQLQDRRYLLFLGRIDRKKGCDLLIDAFIATAKSDPDLDLVMAGPDDSRWTPQLQSRLQAASVAHRVHWTGMLAGDSKWGAFALCEAFVLPSHQENFGISVTEALSCAKPVLISDRINIAPDVAAWGAGLVEADDMTGTIRLLQRWSQMVPTERTAMASNAIACFQSEFDMSANTTVFDDLLERTLHLQSDGHVAATL